MERPGATQHGNSAGAETAPYRSFSEEIVASTLDSAAIEFIYERPTPVPHCPRHGTLEERVWHPDFTLTETDVIVEYCGFPEDTDYLQGISRKVETYEGMGKTVVLLFPEDVWEQEAATHAYRVRDDVCEHIAAKIGPEAIEGLARSTPLPGTSRRRKRTDGLDAPAL